MQELGQAVIAVAAGVPAQAEHLNADAFPVRARGLGDALGPNQLGQCVTGERLACAGYQRQAVADAQRSGEVPHLGVAGGLAVPDQCPHGEVTAGPVKLQP